MRQSKEAAARTRQRIVETAARAYRRQGLAGIGLADVMKEAGLTHGGFYKHFASKDAMVAEAIAHALAETGRSLQAAVAKAPPGEGLKALVAAYLTPVHRDRPEHGCALAALAAEAGRGDEAVRQALADGFRQLAGLVAAQLPPEGSDAKARQAAGEALASALVGTLMLARAMPDRAASDALLQRAAEALLAAFGGRG